MSSWLQLATSASVVRRALITALIVGSMLIAINHGTAILQGTVSAERGWQIALTTLVPYCVSTVSSVGAIRNIERDATPHT